MRASEEEGQSTLELALLLPLVIVVVALVVQVGSVVVTQAQLVQVARAAARVGVVSSDAQAITVGKGATRLDPSRVVVQIRRTGGDDGFVEVRVSTQKEVVMPLTNVRLARVELREQAVMMNESGGSR